MAVAPSLPPIILPSSQAARTAYRLAYEISPIILHNGIAAFMPEGLLPIMSIGSASAALAAATGSNSGLSVFPFEFVPIPGGSVVNNAVGMYSFANQATAANAVISQPINISMLMIAPVKDDSGYLQKQALFTALITVLNKHRDLGGTFHVMTPAYLYSDCLLTSVNDATGGDGYQQQIKWQFDFVKPLVTQSQLAQALNTVTGKLQAGQPL